MRIPSQEAWLIVAVISGIAAGISAAFLAMSASAGIMINMILSAISLILFIACLIVALTARSKLSRLNKMEVEIKYLKLKKPGVERPQTEEIVPKGKMPKE